MPPENNEEFIINEDETKATNQKSRLHQVTPLSKFLTIAIFIILPFLGAYIGYVNAPEKVVEVERVENINSDNIIKAEPYSQTSKEGDSLAGDYLTEDNMPPSIEFDPASFDVGLDKIEKLDVGAVLFPASNEFVLDVPGGWDVEKSTEMTGSTKITKYFFYDSEEKMAFVLSYPVREIGYEFSISKNKRVLPTEAGIELDVVDRVMEDDPSSGFVHYVGWSEGDWQDSFEIFIPFGDDLYARTNMENYDGGVETRYKSYQDYLYRQKSSSDTTIDEIITGIYGLGLAKYSEYDPENTAYMIESATIIVSEADKEIVAEVRFGLGPSVKVTTTFDSKDTVLDAVLTAVRAKGVDAHYIEDRTYPITYID